MKTSRAWLNRFFEEELPASEAVADALTFSVAEVEEVKGDLIDVNILPDRAPYMLCHRGVAKEIAVALGRPLKEDPLRTALPEWQRTEELDLHIDTDKARRHMAAIVRGVKVGPSPSWLTEALESVGQRSINNIVDATNFVTLNMGQPLHAFDAGKIARTDGRLVVGIRHARDGEQVVSLSGETYTLTERMLVICEGKDGKALDIAGIKGGADTGVDEGTTELLVSVANFDGTTTRQTAQTLKLWTDASQRFQNKLSPDLVAYGMRDILALIQEIAGGEVVGVADVYPEPYERTAVSVELTKVNRLLGTSYAAADIERAFDRLGFLYEEEGGTYTVEVPFERGDLQIPEDLVEEVGRVLGYGGIQSVPLPALSDAPALQKFNGIERVKDLLIERGYTEIATPSFAVSGEVYLANPLDMTRPALRSSLSEHMAAALQRAVQVAPRVVGPEPKVRLFELGSIFTARGEQLALALGYAPVAGKRDATVLAEIVDALATEFPNVIPAGLIEKDGIVECVLDEEGLAAIGDGYAPRAFSLDRYVPFSVYPFALRDIAVWTPEGTEETEVSNLIVKEAGEHLVRIDRFDRFEKDGRISYAFRLVFESMERTLADTDLDPAMARVTDALNSREGWTVR